jgi:hypothetical protein
MKTKITITEALAEIPLLKKRIGQANSNIMQYLTRPQNMLDPLEKDGGSVSYIKGQMQSIADLEARIVNIRDEIARANMTNTITVGDVTKTIAQWLWWRREVFEIHLEQLRDMSAHIQNKRSQAQNQTRAARPTPYLDQIIQQQQLQATVPTELVVNYPELTLLKEIEAIEETEARLDGQLSLKNAQIIIEV